MNMASALWSFVLVRGHVSTPESQSARPNVCPPINPSFNHLFVCPSIPLSVRPLIRQPCRLSRVRLSVCPSVHPFFFLSVHPSIHLSVRLPAEHSFVPLAIHPSINSFLHPSICPFLRPSVRLPVHPSAVRPPWRTTSACSLCALQLNINLNTNKYETCFFGGACRSGRKIRTACQEANKTWITRISTDQHE